MNSQLLLVASVVLCNWCVVVLTPVAGVTSPDPDTRHLHICNQTLILLPAALIRIHCICVQEYFKIMINTNWSHRGTEPVTISNLCSWSLSMTRALRSSVTRLRILRSPAIGETFLEHGTGDRVRNVDTEWWPHIGTRLLTLTSDHGAK